MALDPDQSPNNRAEAILELKKTYNPDVIMILKKLNGDKTEIDPREYFFKTIADLATNSIREIKENQKY